MNAIGITEDPDAGAVVYPLPPGILVDRNVRVPMRDGVPLAATVFRPDAPGRFPVVMCITAYGKDFGPADYSTLPKLKQAGMALGAFHISDATSWEGPDPGFWVPNGYCLVVADARGFFASDGVSQIFSRQDAEDYSDLIAWAAAQAWSSGAVGLNGVSYLAINQWLCASQTPPEALKAIVPWEGFTDAGRDSLRQGGIPETRFTEAWVHGSLARGGGGEIVQRAPAMLADLLAKPFPIERIEVPALICGSWSDQGLHSRGAIEGFMRIASKDKWLFTHGRNKWDVYYSAEALEWQKAFFDRFLKGEDNGFDARPRVRLEVRKDTHDYELRSETDWPLEGARYTPLYLDLARGMLSAASLDDVGEVAYEAEVARHVEFDLEIFERTELTGPMSLKLWVSAPESDDLDLFVALRKIAADGREVHFCGKDGDRKGVVSSGWLRVSERLQDPDLSRPWRPFLSHTKPQKLRPGEIVPVEIEILPSSTLFEPGDRLRLVLSGRDIVSHPRFGHDQTVNHGRHVLHAGGRYDSHLLAPLVLDR